MCEKEDIAYEYRNTDFGFVFEFFRKAIKEEDENKEKKNKKMSKIEKQVYELIKKMMNWKKEILLRQ